MADFVLVHGAWHGAWCWKRVLPGLWQAGHRAHAVALTGVGERKHLVGAGVTLATHIEDVLNVIEAEELQDAILVGHSYSGMVVTGVADRAHDRIGHLVYLDAVIPDPGESWSSRHTPDTQQQRRDVIARQGVLPAADPTVFGLQGEDYDWVARRQTPQPGGVYDSPLAFDAQRVFSLPKTFIDCTDPALPTIAASRRRVRSEPGWRVVEIATGHDPMISAPQELLRELLRLA
jgi:pimeloyl-ACP methyl ester carboxylesterase